jgi:hypothetical protein
VTTRFRNVDTKPADPPATWPYEALVTVIERGSVHDWARVTRTIARDPWGEVARSVEDYLGYADESGVTALLRRAVTRARQDTEDADRAAVAARVRHLISASGLTAAQFAARAGTSSSRMSTYVTGKVVPSAAMMLRLERLAR